MSELPGMQNFDLSSFSEADLQRLAEKTNQQLESIKKSKREIPVDDDSVVKLVESVKSTASEHEVFPRSVISALCKSLKIDVTFGVTVGAEEFAEADKGVKDKAEPSTPTAAEKAPKKKAPSKRGRPTGAKNKGKIGLKSGTPRSRKPSTPAPAEKGAPTVVSKRPRLTPKYRHPENTDMTWSGAGKKPRWVIACLESGMDLEDLRTK